MGGVHPPESSVGRVSPLATPPPADVPPISVALCRQPTEGGGELKDTSLVRMALWKLIEYPSFPEVWIHPRSRYLYTNMWNILRGGGRYWPIPRWAKKTQNVECIKSPQGQGTLTKMIVFWGPCLGVVKWLVMAYKTFLTRKTPQFYCFFFYKAQCFFEVEQKLLKKI